MAGSQNGSSDSRETMVRVLGDVFLKLMIVAAGCAMVVGAVFKFILQGNVTIEQVVIIAGLGYTAARETFFRSGRKSPGG